MADWNFSNPLMADWIEILAFTRPIRPAHTPTGDTRLGSYYETILNLILMFSVVVNVLEIIEEDSLSDQSVFILYHT